VVRRTGSRLKRIYDKLIHETASQHLISRALYRVCYARIERAQLSICARCGFFYQYRSDDE
jgi:hypothetical protein